MAKRHHIIRSQLARSRRGNVLTMTAFLLPVLFILSAFAVNIAYMQLTRTELMVATDASARAGGRALSELQDVDEAKSAAMVTAALNSVAGSPLRVKLDDASNEIEFGASAASNNGYGRFSFSKKNTQSVRSGAEIANAVRVTAGRNAGSQSGSVDLPFPGFGLPETWDVVTHSVAVQVDRDIALVLDRSGSMSWKTYDWPRGKSPWNTSIYDLAVTEGLMTKSRGNYNYAPGVSAEDYQDWVWEEYYGLGTPPRSPWDDLKLAVQSFLAVLDTTDQSEYVSLTSYASNATLDLPLQSSYPVVVAKMETLIASGSTAIGSGMQTGLPTLFDVNYARPYAAKTLIVMTDGMHNTGTDPVTVAQSIISQYNVTIHSVTFSPGADQARMKQVASIGGGQHYHANDGAQLVSVFKEIANNLPTIITE